jgi:hypothetical protein
VREIGASGMTIDSPQVWLRERGARAKLQILLERHGARLVRSDRGDIAPAAFEAQYYAQAKVA